MNSAPLPNAQPAQSPIPPPAQYSAFDSLHWFQSVRDHHVEEKARVEDRAGSAEADDKLKQTLALTLKRLDTHQKVLCAAKITRKRTRADFQFSLGHSGMKRGLFEMSCFVILIVHRNTICSTTVSALLGYFSVRKTPQGSACPSGKIRRNGSAIQLKKIARN